MRLKRNKAILIVFAVSASLIGPAPAQAAENLQCVLSIRTKAVDAAAFAAYRSHNLGAILGGQPGKQITACAQKNQWSATAHESAAFIFLNEIVEAGITKDLIARKLAADRIGASLDDYLTNMRDAELEKLAGTETLEDHMQIAVRRLIVSDLISQRQLTVDTSTLIGEYLTAKANLLLHRARFDEE